MGSALSQYITKYYMVAKPGLADPYPIGTVLHLSFPPGCEPSPILVECDGRQLDSLEYPELHDVIGDMYGTYNAVPIKDEEGIRMDNDAVDLWDYIDDSFRLPDLRGKAV